MTYIANRDFLLEISRGKVNGFSHVNKFGKNTDLDTGAAEDIWDGGGLYVPPTNNRIHTIVSTSTEDAGTLISSGTSTGGSLTTLIDTGATFIADGVSIDDLVLNDTNQDHSTVHSIDSETQLTVHTMHHDLTNNSGDSYRIVNIAGTGAAIAHVKIGYELDGTEHNEFIILNGTTGVATTNSYYRITRMHIHGVGSTGSNAGNITATAAAPDSTVTAQINAGNGQTLMAFYHIPFGKHGYLTNFYVSLNKTGGVASTAEVVLLSDLWSNHHDGTVVKGFASLSTDTGPIIRKYDPPLSISQGSDIWFRCETVSASNTDVTVEFDIILVDN